MKICSYGMRSLLGAVGGIALLLAVIAIIIFCSQPSASENISAAAMQGNLDHLKKLEAKGVSLDAQNRHAFGWTPLMAAIYMQQTNIIQYLLTRNVNLDLRDSTGRTALMWAITTKDTNTVRLLLEKGADANIKDIGGVNAFGYAETSPYHALFLEWLNKQKTRSR
jgi:ankyrin repeat protein